MRKLQILAGIVLTLGLQVNICYAHSLSLNSLIGKGEYGDKVGSATEAVFRNPYGIAFDKNNNLYIVDSKNNMIKKVINSVVSTVVGKIKLYDTKGLPIGGFKDGTLANAEFSEPRNMALKSNGEFVITDTNNNLIRLMTSSKVVTLAGTGEAGYLDGKNTASKFNKPTGVAIDDKGDIYIADTGNNVIRKMSTSLGVTTFAGKCQENGGYTDGDVQNALFNEPTDIYISGSAIYVADSGNQAIRKIENGQVTTIAGRVFYNGTESTYASGGDVNADVGYSKLNFPKAIAVLTDGTVVIADTWNKKIKYIDKSGRLEDFKLITKNQDGTTQDFNIGGPIDMVENAGKLYVSDIWDNCIYVFDIEIDSTDEQPIIIKDKTLYKGEITDIPVTSDEYMVGVPLRKFFETIGATVSWLPDTCEAVVKIDDNEYRFQTDGTSVKIMDSRMYVGVNYLREKYKIDVVYDKNNNAIFAY